MLRCVSKHALIGQLAKLKYTDEGFAMKFEEIVRKIKEHMVSGHPTGNRRKPTWTPCSYS
jgi:hypothetical protein